MDYDNILLSAAADLYTLCEKRGSAVFSRFYDGAEQVILKDNKLINQGAFLYGGHTECERKILGVFPDWQEPDTEEFPISLIKISLGFSKNLTHRDYLGSLMGLGIERDRIGDIVVCDKEAYVFVHNSVSDYVINNLKKIGSCGVKLCYHNINDFVYPEGKYTLNNVVVASTRLDAVVGAAANLSRSKAANLIEKDKVSVDHRPINDCSKKVNQGELLSIRGFGRYQVEQINGETRSGRLHLTIKKYL